jgi:hypothetical protein
VLVIATLLSAAPATAYRPFDGTDADVAERGEIELELGPVGYRNEDGADLVVAPDLVANVGVHPRLEIVAGGRGLVPLDRETGSRRYRFVDTTLLAKGLLRRGSLQGAPGPSAALELGILLPTLRGEAGVGFEGIGIVSHRFAHVTMHLNLGAAYTCSTTWEIGSSMILEGPSRWGARPVAEATFFGELDEASAASGLVGAIWEPREGLAFDLGVRYARHGGTDVREIRAGLTWSFAGW